MKVSKFFHHLFVKAESGLDKLISAEDRINTALYDNERALEQQVENAKQLFSSKAQFEEELSKVEKEVARYKTQCEVLKNKGLTSESDDLRIAAAQYLENKKVLDDLKVQQAELDKTAERVEKILKKLKLNKALLETKASALKTKIKMYQVTANIDQNGIVDIDTTFAEVDDLVNKMKFDQEASQHVNDLVNGKESNETYKNAEIDDFLATL